MAESRPLSIPVILGTNRKRATKRAGGAIRVSGAREARRCEHLVTIFWDENVGSVGKAFDESGELLDPAFVRRTDKFLGELIWMARTLRHGRENIPLN